MTLDELLALAGAHGHTLGPATFSPGDLVAKTESEEGDIHQDGAKGCVVSVIDMDNVCFGYFVQWTDVLAFVVPWKVRTWQGS